jgi:hypothetical protein
MMEIIRYLIFSSTLCSIAILVALVFTLSVFAIIYSQRKNDNLKNMSNYVYIIPLLAGLIPMAGLIDILHNLIKAISLISAKGIGASPNVVSAGFAELFLTLLVCGSFFFFVLEAWLILRMIYGKFVNSISVQDSI